MRRGGLAQPFRPILLWRLPHPCLCAVGRDRVGNLNWIGDQIPRPVANSATRTRQPRSGVPKAWASPYRGSSDTVFPKVVNAPTFRRSRTPGIGFSLSHPVVRAAHEWLYTYLFHLRRFKKNLVTDLAFPTDATSIAILWCQWYEFPINVIARLAKWAFFALKVVVGRAYLSYHGLCWWFFQFRNSAV
jgi:hypothetical protein